MRELEELKDELAMVEMMDESVVCATYNADCKDDVIAVLVEEIEIAKSNCEELPEEEADMDYDALCYSQGLSRYC